MRAPEFQRELGLFSIDELHVVSGWREFRPDYALLYSLMALLPGSIPWFGCTATLAKDKAKFIIEKAGFEHCCLKVIRTSVDRPEISLIMQPLLRGCIKDFRRLLFLV
jgi:superfamily II DNA helicase RecQ